MRADAGAGADAVAGAPDSEPPLLVLFDIDGTLLHRAAAEHAQALHEALRAVHGLDLRGRVAGISPAGRTDGEIARLMLLRAGVSARTIDERAQSVRDACCEAYARLCPASLEGNVLPGVPGLLGWLQRRDDARLGLVTGNYEPVARLKLARAGIGRHFAAAPGAFGSDCEDRAALPGIARRRAGGRGASHPRARTVVIGDTPRDIACARADGVRCLAVATGGFDATELEGADAVASAATALREPLELLLAG